MDGAYEDICVREEKGEGCMRIWRGRFFRLRGGIGWADDKCVRSRNFIKNFDSPRRRNSALFS